jgi:hypothetical protein
MIAIADPFDCSRPNAQLRKATESYRKLPKATEYVLPMPLDAGVNVV